MNREVELIKSEIYEANANLEKFTKLLKNESENINYSFYVTYFTNRLNILQQIKTILEEYKKLKVKATPKKPIRFKNSIYISNPKCPMCKTIPHTGNQKYCDECGQALDWSDEEVKVEDE